MNQTANYGNPILSGGWLNFNPRIRNRILTRLQYRFLDWFEELDAINGWGKSFSRMSRSMIGGYLYSLKLEINSNCNLNCRMCYVPKNDDGLEPELIRKLMKELKNSGTRLEILGGEPLARKDLPEIVRLGKRTAHLPFISVYTNGTCATKELCGELRAAGLDAALVTLISPYPAIHDRFTGVEGSWQKTIEGILNFRDSGIKTYTFTAIHKENGKDIRLIHDFVSKKLHVSPLFYQYIPQQKDDPLVISRKKWYSLKNWVLAQHSGHSAFVRNFYMISGNACSGGNFVLTVKADGSVQPCPFISDLPLGHIREQNIWTIFKNRYKNTGLEELKCLPETCSGCSLASVCGGGCRAGNRKLSGSYAHPDFRCLGPFQEENIRDSVIERTPCFF